MVTLISGLSSVPSPLICSLLMTSSSSLFVGFESWSTLLNFTALELSEELKHLAASSSTVQPLASSSPKKPLFEIMVQGSQEKLVLQLLEKKGVPRGCVVVDSSKVKK